VIEHTSVISAFGRLRQGDHQVGGYPELPSETLSVRLVYNICAYLVSQVYNICKQTKLEGWGYPPASDCSAGITGTYYHTSFLAQKLFVDKKRFSFF
jgi:hypothetical protein